MRNKYNIILTILYVIFCNVMVLIDYAFKKVDSISTGMLLMNVKYLIITLNN